MHHMDVVPADRSQWKTNPFEPTIRGNELWARGAMDMKGQGVAQLLAFLRLKRERVPLDARRHSAGRTGRGSGWRARRAVDDREPLCRAGPGVRPRRRRLRQPRSVCARQARLRHLRRRKEDRLAEAPSGRRGGTWQPAERSESQRSPGAGRSSRLLAESRSRRAARSATAVGEPSDARRHEGEGRHIRPEQVHERHPAVDHRADLVPVGRRRSAQDQRHPLGGRGRPRLPGPAGHDQGSVDRRSEATPRRSRHRGRTDQRIGRPGRHVLGRAALPPSRSGHHSAGTATPSSRRC